jgi:dihydrofolate reductase
MARKITGSLFVSLDGVIQAPGGPTEDPTNGFDEGGWLFKLPDDGVNQTLGELFGGAYDLLLGRRTYDIFAAYWPYVEGPEAALGKAFSHANKYVLTGSNAPLPWENSHRLTDWEEVAKLKQSEGPDLIVQGSGSIYPGLLGAGLLDRLILITYPVILGRGKRWFGAETPARKLDMTDHYVTDKGTIIASYAPGGDLPAYPADALTPSTSDREAERQARIANGTW